MKRGHVDSRLDSHRRAAQDEDLAFLLAHGVPLIDALPRVGLTPDAYEQRQTRTARR